ncbi:MAG: TolB family protein [Candidatus Promineifilaceae bacterium]
MKRDRRLANLLIGLLMFLAACQPDVSGKVVREPLALAAGYYGPVMWLSEERLLVFYRGTWDYLEYPSNVRGEVRLESDPRCTLQTVYLAPEVLPDGRLGLVKDCVSLRPQEPPAIGGHERYLVAYDWQSQTVEQIVAGPLPTTQAAAFSWNPDMTRGVQALAGLLGTLYWLTPAGYEPMEVTVGEGARSWSLAENLRILLSPDADVQLHKRDVGIADNPSWSPDGGTIAFFASTAAINRSGPSRGDGEYHLYLMDPVELRPEPALGKVYYPSFLAWSPDSRWLAFLGRAGALRASGLWLFNPEDNELELIEAGEILDATWSPDGTQLAVTRCGATGCENAEVFRYDVSALVGHEQG